VWLLSKNIALYCAKKRLDVRSNSIHPTFIEHADPRSDPEHVRQGEAEAKLGRQVPLGRIGKPEEIAARRNLSPLRRKPVHHGLGTESRWRHLGYVICRRRQ
jgi:NAD(P)-dependent dehydrogenase (short-subunit alcohol dehydrogenase family)